MDDVPSNMPRYAHGLYEPDGFWIWVNKDIQGNWDWPSFGVLSHEFTHYVHSVSTFQCVIDLIDLIFVVHSGIQHLEDILSYSSLPISKWTASQRCPDEVRRYAEVVKVRRKRISEALGVDVDEAPPRRSPTGSLYARSLKLFIKTSHGVGVRVARLSLMEGAALAKKCETLGSNEDLIAKKRNKSLVHYYAIQEACQAANPWIDSLQASMLLCDISLCVADPGEIFQQGLSILQKLPRTASVDDLAVELEALYHRACRTQMASTLNRLQRVYAMVPENHRKDDDISWGELALRNAIAAVRLRQQAPLSLIRTPHSGEQLLNLASQIGSPVIVTNDMRLTGLCKTSPGVDRARSAIRVVSYLCDWLMDSAGPLRCPYAGCPGCPTERSGPHCATNAALALLPPDETSWCALLSAAHQLRVANLIRNSYTTRR